MRIINQTFTGWGTPANHRLSRIAPSKKWIVALDYRIVAPDYRIVAPDNSNDLSSAT